MANTHKRFSSSSLHRVMSCGASLLFIESLPESLVDRRDSIFARRGTAGHEVSEMVLKSATLTKQGKVKLETKPMDYLGQEVNEVIIDEEILSAVVPYVRYALSLFKKAGFHKVEAQLDLSRWNFLKDKTLDGEECGGTMDFVAFYRQEKRRVLEVVDLKTGSGVLVEVRNNPQLLNYGLCALLAYYKKYRPTHVKITIAQPLMEHPDGHIRSVTVEAKELLRWGKEIMVPRLEYALSGQADFNPTEENCQWCPGKAQCKPAYQHACDNALSEFSDVIEIEDNGDRSEVTVLDHPDVNQLTPEQKLNILQHGDGIISFIHAVKAAEHIRAERGEEIDGFKLIYKRSNRVYKTDDSTVRKALHRMGLQPADFTVPPALFSPSKVETVLASKGVGLDKQRKFFDTFVEKPETGTNLVPESHKGRAVRPAIEVEFASLIEIEEATIDLLDF